MSINTEAAELLHAVADLYECGALEWIKPGEYYDGYVQMSLSLAVVRASRELSGDDVMHAAIDATRQEAPTHLYYWQRRKDRTVKDVIALLRRAAQRLEKER